MNSPRFSRAALFVAGCFVMSLGVAHLTQEHREGSKDGPLLPGQKWRVHDIDRPYPPAVAPGVSVGAPPSDAIVLFDGKDLSRFCQFSGDGGAAAVDPKWKLVDGTIQVAPGTGSLYSRDKFGDCQLHIEWQEDAAVTGSGQGRGNSGLFLASRYEIQILDSYQSATYADGQAGAIYGQWPPMVNPMRKPGEWQTYDVIFRAPRFSGEKLIEPAYLTLLFNGVLVHDHQRLYGPTTAGQFEPYVNHGDDRFYLQDHGPKEKLRFRNIWVRKLKDAD